MKYQIESFIYFPSQEENNYIIQTKKKSLVTQNIALINFLRFIEQNNISEIEYDTLFDILGGDNASESSINFLVENTIITPLSSKELDFETVVFLSNDTKFLEVGKIFWENSCVYKLSEFPIIENSLVIVAINPFSLLEYKRCLAMIRNETNIVKFIFPYNHSIYMSNYYSEKWGNPCPLCFFYSLEAQLRGEQYGEENLNFQTMLDLFYKETEKFVYDGMIDKVDWLPVFSQLYKDMSIGNALLNKVDDVIEIRLNEYTVSYDVAYFWEMCDCYE